MFLSKIRLCDAARCIYLPTLHLLNVTYDLPTFTTRYLFKHTFVNIKDCPVCLRIKRSNLLRVMEMSPQTDRLRTGWAVTSGSSTSLITCFLPFYPKDQTIKKPDDRHLDALSCPPFCLLPFQGWTQSLPLTSQREGLWKKYIRRWMESLAWRDKIQLLYLEIWKTTKEIWKY